MYIKFTTDANHIHAKGEPDSYFSSFVGDCYNYVGDDTAVPIGIITGTIVHNGHMLNDAMSRLIILDAESQTMLELFEALYDHKTELPSEKFMELSDPDLLLITLVDEDLMKIPPIMVAQFIHCVIQRMGYGCGPAVILMEEGVEADFIAVLKLIGFKMVTTHAGTDYWLYDTAMKTPDLEVIKLKVV